MADGARDPAAAREAAHAILRQAQFRQPPESPIDRARHWVGQQLDKALNAVFTGHLGLWGGILLVAVVAVLVVLIVRAARGVRTEAAFPGAVFGGRGSRTPAEWRADAAACEAAGDYRGALRAHYRALVADLCRRGLVDDIPGLTAGEYRVAVAIALPPAAGDFAGATDLFESAVYGHADAGPDDTDRIKRLAQRVEAAAR